MSYNFRTVQLNRGGTSYSAGVFGSGTSVTIDATNVQIKWKNTVLQVVKPLSKGNQSVSYNAAAAYTATANVIQLDAGNFDSGVAVGDIVVISGIDYIIIAEPAANQVTVTKTPPATGTLTVYKGIITWLSDLKRIVEIVTISGFLVDDYTFHPALTSKKYAEEKIDDLYYIVGATSNTPGLFNLVLREDSFLKGRYMRQSICTDLTLTDTNFSEPAKSVSSIQRVKKIGVSMTIQRGIPK